MDDAGAARDYGRFDDECQERRRPSSAPIGRSIGADSSPPSGGVSSGNDASEMIEDRAKLTRVRKDVRAQLFRSGDLAISTNTSPGPVMRSTTASRTTTPNPDTRP